MTKASTPTKMRFNKTLIEGLKPPDPPADRYYIYDSQKPGLCVCVTATGKKNFYLYRRFDGKPERVKLGSFPQTSVENARDLVDKHVGGYALDGKNPAEQRRIVRATMMLGELWDFYLESHAKPRKRSWEADEWLWTKFLKPRWEDRKISQIRRADFAALHDLLGANSVYNANRVRSLVLGMYNFASDRGFSGENPAARVKPFPEVKRERYLSADEINRLFRALDAEPNQTIADAIRFALWTGARKGNWLSARWDEVDVELKVWTIPAGKSKSGKAIIVPLPSQALDVLKRRKAADDASPVWLFPSVRGDGHIVSPKKVWKAVCKAAAIADARIHDLRRTLATFAVSAGVPLFQVAKLLGHSNTVVTEAVYARQQDAGIRDASDKAAAAMDEAAKSKKRKTKDGRK